MAVVLVESLGGWASRVSAVVSGSESNQVYVIGADNAVWIKGQERTFGDWSNWESLGGWGREISTVRTSRRDGGIEVFVIRSDNSAWFKWQNHALGDWNDWTSLGGTFFRRTEGQGALACRHGRVRRRHGWVRPRAPAAGPLRELVRLGHDRRDPGEILRRGAYRRAGGTEIFAVGQDDTIIHSWRGGGSGAWAVWIVLDYEPPPPPPSDPVPPPPTYVPGIVGRLSCDASEAIWAADLRIGFIVNPTGEIRSSMLQVVRQDPAPGTWVEPESAVNYTVERATPSPSSPDATWQGSGR